MFSLGQIYLFSYSLVSLKFANNNYETSEHNLEICISAQQVFIKHSECRQGLVCKENIWQIALRVGVGFKSRFCNLCQLLKPSPLLYLVCKHSVKIIFIICEKILSEIHIQDTKEEHVFV